MQKSPFDSFHEKHNARFVDFAGWRLPIHYGSIIEEHRQTRESGGLFDVSHMGRLHITGRHARRLIERVSTRRVTDMAEHACRYSMLCNEQGGVLDDVIIYRFADHWMIVCNASNRPKVVSHLQQVQADDELVCKIDDQTEKTAMVAVQGPNVMERIGNFSREVPNLKRYHFCVKNLMVLKMTISRTGYTGEDGVEVILGANMAQMAIKMLLKDADEQAWVKPCGLGARDTLRIEAGMPLYGHELDEQTDPLSAGLKFGVTLDKHETTDGPEIPKCIGHDALKKIATDGPTRKLVGIKLDGKRTARQGADVLAGEAVIGQVTSGCLSPTLEIPIAMAYVGVEHAQAGKAVDVTVGSKRAQGELCDLPFYKLKL